MSSMGAAMQRAGVKPEDVAFDIAIAKYLNSGGTFERAHERLRIAERMSGAGREQIAGRLPVDAQARQPVEDARGRNHHASNGLLPRALSSSSNRGGGGHSEDAQSRAIFAVPVREPSASQRTAAASVAKVVALTILDTLKIDGRAVGDWTVGEARSSGRAMSREGYILIEAARTVANATGAERLRDVVKPDEMQKIIQRAAEFSDAI